VNIDVGQGWAQYCPIRPFVRPAELFKEPCDISCKNVKNVIVCLKVWLKKSYRFETVPRRKKIPNPLMQVVF
jgi:hypothetical protein